ncbi:hypothetical protein HKCCE3408_17285 [Rhodobacterales bacterium HKCCE3408]|nr:hypothetical protein [Rhodobacterales bacterium HKCCE3408]
MPLPAKVSIEGDATVVVTRDFDAPRAAVWRAHSEPALLKRWLLGPPGWEMHVCEMDFRPGGSYRWRWRNVDAGVEFGFDGEVLALDPPARMEERQTYIPGTVGGEMGTCDNVLTLTEIDGGTRLVTRISYADRATMEAAMATGMTDGMEMSYALLDGVLADGDA